MTRKEFFVENASTKKEALGSLEFQIAYYLYTHELTPWKWRIKPETDRNKKSGRWKAYARIEMEKSL